jgi:protein kinase X
MIESVNTKTEYQVIRTIGEGSYGRVKLIKNKKTKKTYALKILPKQQIIDLRQINHVYSELTILKEISHPFIVHLNNFFQDETNLYFQSEYVAGGELFTLMLNEGKLQVEQVKFYSAQLVSIFEYLHSKKIIYRDLKPENVLINSTGYLKLTDFGMAKRIESKTYTICGTPEYMAPEIVLNQGHGSPADWWSLGILLYEMLVGITPFTDKDPTIIYQKVIEGKYHFPKEFDK